MKLLSRIYLFAFALLSTIHIWGQQDPVEVAQLTMKVGAGEQKELYYSFAEGDQIVFNFEEINGKPLKELKITELPSNTRFQEFKTSSIIDKIIKVHEKSVYRFYFYNSTIARRVCKITIQRIPASPELISFNTDWRWEIRYDTSYTPYMVDSIIGYDTLFYKETVKEISSTEIVEELLFDKNEWVHSNYNPNPNRTYLHFTLPKNNVGEYKTEKVLAWAYWIGVNDEGREAYAQNMRNMGGMVADVAGTVYSPIASIAIGVVTELMIPTSGENVAYYFMDSYQNTQAFMNNQTYYHFDKGKGVAAYGKCSNKLQGTYYIGLFNDNETRGIEVNVKVVAIKEIKEYKDVTSDRVNIKPRYVTLNKRRMEVNKRQVRVSFE